jgi:glycine/D-amino acid oxidase-like deaminating enzyme
VIQGDAYDWIVVGAGLTGAALAYELAKQSCSVLLLDRPANLCAATPYSYGGIAYWSGTTEFARILCSEGIAIHRGLSAELEADTQFRELDLVLTLSPEEDGQTVAANYATCAMPPTLVDVQTACELEPLLNPGAIAGALTVKHGHVCPKACTEAYTKAFVRLGGTFQMDTLLEFRRSPDGSITGVRGQNATYASKQLVICAGGWSRLLVQPMGVTLPLLFTRSEIVELAPTEIQLRTLVMPATIQRFQMEAAASQNAAMWDQPGQEAAPMILDAGAIQFQDRRICLGQISRTLTDLTTPVDATTSEQMLRQQVGKVLPALHALSGIWRECTVGFTGDRLPFVGAVPQIPGLSLFTGFSNPFAIVPPLARRFATQVTTGHLDPLLTAVAPDRVIS